MSHNIPGMAPFVRLPLGSLTGEFKPPLGPGIGERESLGNVKKKRRTSAAVSTPAQSSPVLSDLLPPPLTGYGDTIVASNPFDDSLPQLPSSVTMGHHHHHHHHHHQQQPHPHQQQHLSPHQQHLSPHQQHLSPHQQHLSPHQQHLSPHQQHLSPHQQHLSPHQQHLSPHQQHLSPHQQHLSPHQQHLSPHHHSQSHHQQHQPSQQHQHHHGGHVMNHMNHHIGTMAGMNSMSGINNMSAMNNISAMNSKWDMNPMGPVSGMNNMGAMGPPMNSMNHMGPMCGSSCAAMGGMSNLTPHNNMHIGISGPTGSGYAGPGMGTKPMPVSTGKVYPPDQPMVFNPQNPNAPPIYPCGICHKEVHDNDQAILCESGCNFWFHRVCTGLTEAAYQLLTAEVYAEWVCDKCLSSKNIPLVKFKP